MSEEEGGNPGDVPKYCTVTPLEGVPIYIATVHFLMCTLFLDFMCLL